VYDLTNVLNGSLKIFVIWRILPVEVTWEMNIFIKS